MSEENKILNKGLDALLGQNTNNNQKSVKELPVEDINPGRFQPRTNFDEEKLSELTNSIKNHGVLSPILVREVGLNKYEVIAGERRLRASKNAGPAFWDWSGRRASWDHAPRSRARAPPSPQWADSPQNREYRAPNP